MQVPFRKVILILFSDCFVLCSQMHVPFCKVILIQFLDCVVFNRQHACTILYHDFDFVF